MKNTLIILTGLLLPMLLLGQAEFKYQQHKIEGAVVKKGKVNAREIKEDWAQKIQSWGYPHPSGKRAKLNEKKEAFAQQYGLPKDQVTKKAGEASELDDLILNASFKGNAFNGVPNDNDAAISNDGIMVSISNSILYFIDAEEEEILFNRSMTAFASGLGLSQNKYDPKVVYDPEADRFVLLYLNGIENATSKIILAFSVTNDPTEDWNLYALEGNPLDNETWSDYPYMTFSDSELFISVNTFYDGSQNNSGYAETTLWQIDMEGGYEGAEELETTYYNDFYYGIAPIFNVTPMKGGDGSYGDNMYLLANQNLDFENDRLFLMEVTGKQDDPSTTIEMDILTLEQPYYLPVLGRQAANQKFDTNDNRVLGGFYQDDYIEYVQNTTNVGETGYTSVYHGKIRNVSTTKDATGYIYGDDNFDIAFPNISYSGTAEGDRQSIINFNYCSPTDPSGMGAVYHNNGEYSELLVIQEGETYVNVMDDDIERWGDYTGSQRKYDDPGTVWAVGSYGELASGLSARRNATWIGELRTPDDVYFPPIEPPVSVEEEAEKTVAKVYPNPAYEMLYFDFELAKKQSVNISIYDIEGRLVQTLIDGAAKGGKSTIQFSTHLLPRGTYVLTIHDGIENIVQEQFIKQ